MSIPEKRKRKPARHEVRFVSVLEQSTNKLWGAHVRVSPVAVKKLAPAGTRRVVCTLNGTARFQCAMLPHGNGRFVITVNKKLRDSLRLAFGDKVQVELQRDESRYGLPLPEELQVLLDQDAAGDKLFHALTPGKQRTLLYIVGSVKSSEKRIRRAIAVVEHLKAHKGTINYKRLYAALGEPRTKR